MSTQLHHENTAFTKTQFPLILVCNQVASPANIGSIFRLADSFGIQKIFFCGTDITIGGKRMERTARATHKYVSYEVKESIQDVIITLKKEAYSLIALEITDDSIPIDQMDFTSLEKIALIIGEESLGVAPEILNQMQCNTHITMHGNNSSMNVAAATSIAVYEITKQWTPRLNKK
ncbi:TrmH family RNA methyltransferase [Aquimarina rhabdastrellae]